MKLNLIIPFREKISYVGRLLQMSPQKIASCFGFQLVDGEYRKVKGFGANWLATSKDTHYIVKRPTGIEFSFIKRFYSNKYHFVSFSFYWMGKMKFTFRKYFTIKPFEVL